MNRLNLKVGDIVNCKADESQLAKGGLPFYSRTITKVTEKRIAAGRSLLSFDTFEKEVLSRMVSITRI